jgi:uncharacterized membrane protein
MREKLAVFWDSLRSSFWFVPTMMALGAATLSIVTIDTDRVSNAAFANSLGFIWSGGAEGARSILSTIAGSMITVAGVVFSITIVALTLASSQFGPRLLRNFVRDRGNQITLGTFISTFMYCVLVLRTVRVKDEGNFVPFVSVTCGIALAVASIGVLIFFIHHVSRSIQAEFLIAKVGEEFRNSITDHFPEQPLATPSAEAMDLYRRATAGSASVEPLSTTGGYLQAINRDALLHFACENDARIKLMFAPGDFVFHGDTLAKVWIDTKPDANPTPKTVAGFFSIGKQRTESQDVRYGGRQLSEIAARSLSPGINDPYTAMGCIDWGMDALSSVARRDHAVRFSTDDQGVVRLEGVPSGFAALCDVMLEPIISYGISSAIVSLHLIASLQRIVPYLNRVDDIHTLQRYANRIIIQSKRRLEDEVALHEVDAAILLLQHSLNERRHAIQ